MAVGRVLERWLGSSESEPPAAKPRAPRRSADAGPAAPPKAGGPAGPKAPARRPALPTESAEPPSRSPKPRPPAAPEATPRPARGNTEPVEEPTSPGPAIPSAADANPPRPQPGDRWVGETAELDAAQTAGGAAADAATVDDPAELTDADGRPARLRLHGVLRQYAEVIEQTLAEFGVPVRVVQAETGPMLLRFGVAPGYVQKPARGDQPARRERVRAARVVSRQHDLALALGVTSLRIEAPVPGKTYIGIEVPNPHPKPVLLPPLLDAPAYRSLAERGVLPIALGRDVAGQPVLADLARLPHLLIAGATGSGKSVAVNSLIGTLLRSRSPAEVRLIVVDPKRVEFTWLATVPHLLVPVVTEAEQAVEILGKAETEMAHRYDLLAAAGCRNRLAYNARPGVAPLPALVVVIDELADLMMLASDDVERSVCRLAQLGRAAGIHLVVATQRPSVDVITGLIKANLPARLAFAVSSWVDSRTILDSPGAERLLGRGDFLFLAPDAMRPVRGQGTLARDSWLRGVVKTACGAGAPGAPDPEAERFARLLSAAQIADDRLYVSARELAQEHPRVSASFLQRKLRIGYPKALALIERLRADGVIADPDLDEE
jgi:S-DNA-T family DNA segregation ATPase FtsK/SpoIIIE